MRQAKWRLKAMISIVDDDEPFRTAIAGLVRALGFTVETFPSAANFLASPNCRATSCLIADVNMPLTSGVELHQQLLKAGQAVPTILITAYPDDHVRERALAEGVICYLGKPLNEDVLLDCIRTALQRSMPKPSRSSRKARRRE